MKRLLVIGLSAMAVVLFACNDKGTGTESNNTDMHKDMLDANRAVLKAIETGDSATLHKYIADDAVDHGAGENGADVKGPDIVKALLEAHTNIENLKIEVLQDAANNDHVFSLTHMTGTVVKPIWGMPAGMKIDSKSVDLVKVKDTKMIEHWGFMDPAEMMKMMPPGAMPSGGSKSMDSTKK